MPGFVYDVLDIGEPIARDGVLPRSYREHDVRAAESGDVVCDCPAGSRRERKQDAWRRRFHRRRAVVEIRPVAGRGELAVAGRPGPGVADALLRPHPRQHHPAAGGRIVGIRQFVLVEDRGAPCVVRAVVGLQRVAGADPCRAADRLLRWCAELVSVPAHRVEAARLRTLHPGGQRADDHAVSAEAHLVRLAVLRHLRVREKPIVDAQGVHRPLHVVVFVRSADPVFQRRYGIV